MFINPPFLHCYAFLHTKEVFIINIFCYCISLSIFLEHFPVSFNLLQWWSFCIHHIPLWICTIILNALYRWTCIFFFLSFALIKQSRQVNCDSERLSNLPKIMNGAEHRIWEWPLFWYIWDRAEVGGAGDRGLGDAPGSQEHVRAFP